MKFSSFKRMNFFKGFFTRAEDWREGSEYHINKRRLHNASLHTPGIVEGLDVEVSDAGTLIVRPGYAVDGDGRDLYLAEPDEETIDVRAFNPPTNIYVTIQYGEKQTDMRRHPTKAEYSGHAFVEEKPEIEVTAEVPDNDRSIELARVQLQRDATRVYPAGDTDNPGPDQIDKTHVRRAGAVRGSIHLADLATVADEGEVDVAPRSDQIFTHIDTVPAQDGHRFYLADAYPIPADSGDARISWHMESRFHDGSIQYRLYFRNLAERNVRVRYKVYRIK